MTNTQLTIAEVQNALESANPPTLIDVRSVSEFGTGHIPGAVNIPLPELEVRRDDLHGDRIVFICERGMRAEAARSALHPCFPAAQVLQGGMHAWRAAHLPTLQTTRNRWSLERQVRLLAGSLVLIGIALSLIVSPWCLLIAALPGAGLVFAGLTDICPSAIFLLRMPWNQVCHLQPASQTKEVSPP